MKQKDITVGVVYANGTEGRGQKLRLVLAEGPEHILYAGQEDHDCLRYSAWKRDKKGNLVPDAWHRGQHEAPSTRSSFASWAKRYATETEAKEVHAAIAAHAQGRSA